MRTKRHFVPLREGFTYQQFESVVDRLAPLTILVDPQSVLAGYSAGLEGSLHMITENSAIARPSTGQSCHFDHEDLFCTLLTSGTTAAPDLIGKTLYAFHSELIQWMVELKLTSDTKIAIGIPSYHTGGCVIAASQLVAGGAAIFVQDLLDGELLDALDVLAPSVLFLTNRQYANLIAHADVATSRLGYVRRILALGDYFPLQIRRGLAEMLDVEIDVSWGNTEGLGTINRLTREEALEESVPVGSPFLCDEIMVMDERKTKFEINALGRIVGKSDNCYLPDLETADFDPKLVLSEDLGVIGDSGELLVAIRRDNTLTGINGGIFSFGEIEDSLRECPTIRDAALVKVDSPAGREVVVVIVSDSDESKVACATLFRSEFGLRPRVETIDIIPITTGGKVDRLGLRKWLEQAS